VAENVRPPVAIRIVRPYDTEEQLLEHELETVGKTSVVLIGAHPRPTGVILRFEVTLATGATVLRGEGRVLAHKENAFRGQSGLTLRFTRLDPRSKGVVDRATALREARQAEGGTPSRPPPQPDGAIAEALTASTPAPGPIAPSSPPPEASTTLNAEQEASVASARATAREKANATARANARRTGGTIPPSGKSMALTPPPLPVADRPDPTPVTSVPGEVRPIESAPPAAGATPPTSPPAGTSRRSPSIRSANAPAAEARGPARPPAEPLAVAAAAVPSVAAGPAPSRAPLAPVTPPPDRTDLLARLRERAGSLPAERIEEILTARR
jgi:hypothetical protein